MKYSLLIHQGDTPTPRRLGRNEEAGWAYADDLALVHSDAERRFLEQRLADLRGRDR
jgi:predicted RNA polymerase sigma factor